MPWLLVQTRNSTEDDTNTSAATFSRYFISVSIQADQVVARVGRELDGGIDSLFPGDFGSPGSEASKPVIEANLPAVFAGDAAVLSAFDDGYLQLIDADVLMALAIKEDLLIRLERRPGHYLIKGRAMLTVWPAERVTETLRRRDALYSHNTQAA